MNAKHFMTPILLVLLLVYGIIGLILLCLNVFVDLVVVFLKKNYSVGRTLVHNTPKKDIYNYV